MGLFERHTIGVDFGHASLRVVGVSLGRVPTVEGWIEIPVDPSFLQKEGFDNHLGIASLLHEGLKKAQPRAISGQEVYATISETLVFRKMIELPPVATEIEMTKAVHLEAVQFLPENPEEMELDYQILGPTGEGKDALIQVMVVAISKRVSQDFLTIFSAAKLAPKAFEPKPESVARALVDPAEKDAVLIMDVGQTRSTLSICDQGIVRVTSALNIGTAVVDPEEQQDTEAVKVKLSRFVGQLTDEVDHVIKFYQNRAIHTGKLTKICLSGAGSLAEGLADTLSKAVELPVTKSQPMIKVPEMCDRRFYGALGVALYSATELGR